MQAVLITQEALPALDVVSENDILRIHWEAWSVPKGEVSLPLFMQENLCRIRAEHASWAYELGRKEISGRRVESWLDGGETLSMWWCSLCYERHPKMTPSLYPIFKLRALELLLEDRGVTGLSLFGGDDILAKTLAIFCRNKGFSWTWQKGGNPPKKLSLKKAFTLLPPFIQSILRFGHWLWTVWRRMPKTRLTPSSEKTATIVTYFPNIDMEKAQAGRLYSRYWEGLHVLLCEESARLGAPFVRWLFIRFPSPQANLQRCLSLCARFNAEKKDGLSFSYLEEFLHPRDLLRAFRRFHTISRMAKKLEPEVFTHFHLAGSALNFAPYAAEDWIASFRGWRCLERCLQAAGIDNFVEQAGPSRWTLFPLENCPWERMVTYSVQSRHFGPVFGAQHSTLRPTDLRYFDDPRVFADTSPLPVPDMILGNGESAVSQLRQAGVPNARLGMVEALRYCYLANSPYYSQEELSSPKTLLVLTSFFADETASHMRLFVEAFKEGLFSGFNCLLKPHPYLPLDPYLKDLPATAYTVAQGSIASCLVPNTLVWASNSTSAALEAALKGLAVAVMRPVGDFDLCPIQNCPEVIRTADLADVKHMLNEAKPFSPNNYLLIDPNLPRWRALLGIK